MQLGVRDVARILNVSEKSIYRWIQQGQLPTYKVKDQYRFNRAEIFEWANAQKINVSPEIFSEMDSSVEMMPDFGDALEAGGIFYRLEGIGKEAVLRSVVAVMKLPPNMDREFLLRVLFAVAGDGFNGHWRWHCHSTRPQSDCAFREPSGDLPLFP